jgi:hypothetical protein
MTARGKRADGLEVARRRLLAILVDLGESGWPIPCMSGSLDRRALWTSGRADDAELAARLCVACPAVADCGQFIAAWPDEAGVYAGTTEADRHPKAGEAVA